MRCPHCGAENADDRRFCTECGSVVVCFCESCGSRNPPSAKFCSACGKSLVARTHRSDGTDWVHKRPPELRQATVLFADLCGFTRLSRQLDPEATHELLERFFEAADGVVMRYGGSVEKHMGDSVMAVFGAPIAHDNDPERAVRAALGIHKAMASLSHVLRLQLEVHIGIASGRVLASSTGSRHHQQYTVTGDAANLASRLHDAAGPRETLVADSVYHAIANLVEVDDTGPAKIEGFEQPIRVWKVRKLRADSVQMPQTPFVGRRVELDRFAEILGAVQNTGNGHAIFVRGEAGIGKTRLVGEFRSIARGAGLACHTGLVLDFGVGKGRDAIRALVRSLLDLPPGSGKEARKSAAEKALADGFLQPDQQVFLNDLLDLPQPIALRTLYDAMDNAARMRGKQAVVVALIGATSRRRPVLLTIEDIHWADASILAYLAAMTSAMREYPGVLVMTARIEGDPRDRGWLATTEGVPLVTIDLGPLHRVEAMALASAFVDSPDQLVLTCIERSDGNPLFLEQLLRNALESNEQSVPASIESLVLARMDRLSSTDRQAVQTASVIGQRFSLAVLQYVLDDTGYSCSALVDHYFIKPDSDGYLFTHALIQEAVYSSVVRTQRRRLHRRAAQWFSERDAILWAQHLDRADDPAAPRAYFKAAELQATSYRYEQALDLVQRGLTLAQDRSDKFALVHQRGQLLHDLGSIAESTAAYHTALELADDDVGRCRAWIGLAASMRVADKYEEALEVLSRAEAAATARGLFPELARIHHLRGNLYFPLGKIDGVGEQHELALKYAQASRSPDAEARALGGLGDAAYAHGRMITAHVNYRRCVGLCRAHGFGRIEVANLYMIAETRQYSDGVPAALTDAIAAVDAAVKVGHQRAELVARVILQGLLLDAGKLDAAKEHVEIAQALVRRLNARRFEANNLKVLGQILAETGHKSEAIELLQRALAISRETGLSYQGPGILARLASLIDEPQWRRSALQEGEAILHMGAVGHSHLSFYHYAIDAVLMDSDWDSVERYAFAMEDYTRPEPLPWANFIIARGRALAAYGRSKRDSETSRELRRLRNEADRLGLKMALPALDQALADDGTRS